MANYLAQRIIDGALDYKVVTAKYVALKTEIDAYLTAHSQTKLIVT